MGLRFTHFYWYDGPAAEERDMPASKINGVNINWRVVGDRGPWVVMTTGGRRGHDEFIPLAEKIARYGHRVMLHDRRNTGASDILIAGDEGEEVIWTRDMYALLSEQNALPAFFSGSSAGARTSILFYLRYPQAVRGLLLLRVTGGAFAAGRPNYPVMGVSPDGLTAHRLIAGSELHQLPITDQDVPLILFPEWSQYEPEIARVFAEFMKRTVAAESRAA